MIKAQKQILSGPRMSLGSLGILRNYDGNRNAQNAIGLGSEITSLCTCTMLFLLISLASLQNNQILGLLGNVGKAIEFGCGSLPLAPT